MNINLPEKGLPCRHTELRYVLGEVYDIQKHCRVCYLYMTSTIHHKLFGGTDEIVNTFVKGKSVNQNAPKASPEYKKQGLAKRLWNFAAAMKTEAEFRAAGGEGPTVKEKEIRRKLCDTCSDRIPDTDSCGLCGCYLEAQLVPPIPYGKLSLATQKCPKNLWTYAGDYKPKSGCGTCGAKKETA